MGAARPGANAVVPTSQASEPDTAAPEKVAPVYSGFAAAGVFAVTSGPRARSTKPKRNTTPSSTGATAGSAYTPVSVPALKEHLDVYTACLAEADEVLPVEFCDDPLPVLAAVIGVLTTSMESDQLSAEDSDKIDSASCYLAERIATVQAMAIKPSAGTLPSVNMADLVPRGDDGRRRRP